MKIGVCASLKDAERLGPESVDYLECMVFDALIPSATEEDWVVQQERIRKLAIPVEALNCFIPAALKTTGKQVDSDGLDAYVGRVFQRASEIGASIIVFGSGGSRQLPEDFSAQEGQKQIISHLRRWGPLAKPLGITIVVEPLNSAECNFILSVPEAQAIVEATAHPAIRLLADFYHMGRANESVENLVKTQGLLAHVHLAEKATRMFPGFSGQDFRPWLAALKRAGYTGRLTMECAFQDMVTDLPRAVAFLRCQIAEAGCE